MIPTSPSFPNGPQCDRSELEARASRAVKHTPGRWYLVPLPNGDVGIKADGHGFISVIRHNSPNEDRNSEQVENARLIAAAPDLLAACRIALPHIEKSTGDILMIEVLRSAIAKATAPRLDKEGNTDE